MLSLFSVTTHCTANSVSRASLCKFLGNSTLYVSFCYCNLQESLTSCTLIFRLQTQVVQTYTSDKLSEKRLATMDFFLLAQIFFTGHSAFTLRSVFYIVNFVVICILHFVIKRNRHWTERLGAVGVPLLLLLIFGLCNFLKWNPYGIFADEKTGALIINCVETVLIVSIAASWVHWCCTTWFEGHIRWDEAAIFLSTVFCIFSIKIAIIMNKV